MKNKLRIILAALLVLMLNERVLSQANPLADPSLTDIITVPPVLTGPNAHSVTSIRFGNFGIDPIPAHTIQIVVSLNQYFHYVSPQSIPGFEVVGTDGVTVILENNIVIPSTQTYDLRLNTIGFQSTGSNGMGGFQPRPYGASVGIKSGQASNVGNFNSSNDNVSSVIVVGDVLNIPLPLSLLSFSGSSGNCTTQFDWKTASELNVKSFDLEKSLDGINFSPLEKIDAKGSGDNAYSIQVRQKEKAAYYRLLMLDKDNAKKYSQVIRILSNCEDNAFFNVYPNPATTKAPVVLTSSLNELVNYRVMDAASKQLSSGRFQGRTEIRNLVISGTYFIEFQSKTQTNRFKVVVQ